VIAPGPHVLDVKRSGDIRAAVIRALSRPPDLMQAAREYIDQLHPCRDGQASRRVIDATHEFIRDHAGRLKAKPPNLWRKLKIRSAMAFYRVR